MRDVGNETEERFPFTAFTLARNNAKKGKRGEKLPGMTEGPSVLSTQHFDIPERAAHFYSKQGWLSLEAVK